MRSCGFVVLGSLTDHSVGITNEQEVKSILLCLAVEWLEIIELELSIGSFSWLDFRQIFKFFGQILGSKQVITNWLINLHVADIDLDTATSRFALIKNIAECPGNQTSILIAAGSSGHRKGLSGACLTICKNGAIEAFKSRIYNIFGNFIKYLFLSCVHPENLVEKERPFLLFVINVAFLAFLGDEKLGSGLLFADIWISNYVLNPLYTFLCGRTLRMMSIAEFLDINFKFLIDICSLISYILMGG